MKENSPLKDICPDKKMTNHSARKTVVKKLKSSGVPKCEIKNITGHTSTQGLDDYDEGDEREQQLTSRIMEKPKNALSQLFPPQKSLIFATASACDSSHPAYNFSQYHCTVTLNIEADNSAGISGDKRPFNSE